MSRHLWTWLQAAFCLAICAVSILDVAWVASGRVRWEGLLFGIPGALAFGAIGVGLARRARAVAPTGPEARRLDGAA